MGNGPGNSQKSETPGQKFIQVFPGNKNTWINCEEATVLSQLHGDVCPSELPGTVCHFGERQQRNHQVTLPELTRPEQTAFPPPGMLESQSLSTRISWWGFWLKCLFYRCLFYLLNSEQPWLFLLFRHLKKKRRNLNHSDDLNIDLYTIWISMNDSKTRLLHAF